MSGVVSHGPANLYDSSGHPLVSLPITSSLGGGSSFVVAVAIVDQFGNQIVNFGSSGSTAALGPVAVSSGTITLSSAVTLGSGSVVAVSSGVISLSSAPPFAISSAIAISSGTVTLSSNPTVIPSSVFTVTLSSNPTVIPSSVQTITPSSNVTTALSTSVTNIVAVSSGIVTLSSGPTIAVSSGTVTLSSNPTVSPSSIFTVTLSSNPTVIPSSAPTVTPSSVVSVFNSGRSSTGTPTSVTASSSVQLIISSNANRLGGTIYNESNQNLYLLLASSSSPASTASYTLAMVGLSYYEVPYNYVGAITGLWSPSSGFARITELS